MAGILNLLPSWVGDIYSSFKQTGTPPAATPTPAPAPPPASSISIPAPMPIKEPVGDTGFVRGYRHDPNTEEGIESLPLRFSTKYLGKFLEAIPIAKREGIQLPAQAYDPKFLAAMILKEGRYDLGANEPDWENKKVMEVRDHILKATKSHDVADFISLLYEKGQVAKRLGIPFEMAWHGTGRTKTEAGRTISGKGYVQEFPNYLAAAIHPKNSDLLRFIKTSVSTPPATDLPEGYRTGGRVRLI